MAHPLPFSAHQGERKTLQRVKHSFFWHGLTDVLHYVATYATCGAAKKSSRKSRAALQSHVSGFWWIGCIWTSLGPFLTAEKGINIY